ncbi:hypothetical protein BC2230_90239 [Burkholderia cepacia]
MQKRSVDAHAPLSCPIEKWPRSPLTVAALPMFTHPSADIARLTDVARSLGRSLSDKGVYPKVVDDIKTLSPPGWTGLIMACEKQSESQTRRIHHGNMCRTDPRNY